MIETSNPSIDTTKLMVRVREQIGGNHREADTPRKRIFKRLSLVELPRLPMPRKVSAAKQHYALNELLVFYDEAFLESAYEALLGRNPDKEGKNVYLQQLKSGRLNRIEVLARLRYSREGREKRVFVSGLAISFAKSVLFRVPVLGALVEMAIILVRLPARFRHIVYLHDQLASRMAEVERQSNSLSKQTEIAINRLIDELNRERQS